MISNAESTIEMAIDPKQPSLFEKNRNTHSVSHGAASAPGGMRNGDTGMRS
jgi:hypothetical protein